MSENKLLKLSSAFFAASTIAVAGFAIGNQLQHEIEYKHLKTQLIQAETVAQDKQYTADSEIKQLASEESLTLGKLTDIENDYNNKIDSLKK